MRALPSLLRCATWLLQLRGHFFVLLSHLSEIARIAQESDQRTEALTLVDAAVIYC